MLWNGSLKLISFDVIAPLARHDFVHYRLQLPKQWSAIAELASVLYRVRSLPFVDTKDANDISVDIGCVLRAMESPGERHQEVAVYGRGR